MIFHQLISISHKYNVGVTPDVFSCRNSKIEAFIYDTINDEFRALFEYSSSQFQLMLRLIFFSVLLTKKSTFLDNLKTFPGEYLLKTGPSDKFSGSHAT